LAGAFVHREIIARQFWGQA